MRKYLKELRLESNLTQNDIAKKLGISESYYSLIENGHRKNDLSISMVTRLSSIFNVPIDSILANENKTVHI